MKPNILIYTDGACIANPGPGGYGVLLQCGKTQKELSGSFRRTTNNRMELIGPIRALEALKRPSNVEIVSDSEYLVNAFNKGWFEKWLIKGRLLPSARRKVKNPDLWLRLRYLVETHHCTFTWVRGHSGCLENIRCDRLASEAILLGNHGIDVEYEMCNPYTPKSNHYGLAAVGAHLQRVM